jgi:hypothetical protein
MGSAGSVQTAGVSVDIGDTTVIGSGDFNGDGKGELLLSNFATSEAALYSRPVNGTVIGAATYLGTVPLGMTFGGVADTNADGRDDLWFRNVISNKIVEWRMNGTTHTAVTVTNWAGYMGKTWAADLNGDKRADYVRQTSDGTVATFVRSSTGDTFTQENLKDPAPAGWGVGKVVRRTGCPSASSGRSRTSRTSAISTVTVAQISSGATSSTTSSSSGTST